MQLTLLDFKMTVKRADHLCARSNFNGLQPQYRVYKRRLLAQNIY